MATTSNQKNGFIHQIRDQYFYIEVFLYNQLEGYKPFAVPFLMVDSFSLEESLMNWIVKGWITLKADFEILERGSTSIAYYENGYKSTTTPIPAAYVFRTDGRNKISFRIYPLESSGTKSTQPNNEQYPRAQWEMCYDFVIYDIEDLPSENNHKKLRRYYFWDERYQILSERNIEYSTVYTATKNLIGVNDYSTLPDVKKAANPNLAIQDILKTAACNPPIYSNNASPVIKVGFLENGSLDDPKQPFELVNDEEWDNGKNDNLILYTSPANSTAYDDIEYMLKFCISTDGGPVFLRLGRTSLDKTWKLFSLSDYFNNSNLNQIERLFIEDAVVDGKPYTARSYTDVNGNIKNFTSPLASRIKSYKFSQMVAADDMRITNAPVHNYDFSTGNFSITFSNNRAIDVQTKLQEFGKKGLFNFSSNNPYKDQAHVLLNINKTKQEGISLKNNFVPQKFYPKNMSQLQMLKDALFLNEAICFQVRGLTIRTPGKFLFIDRIGSNGELNPFDDRFLGQWLIVKVNHVFSHSGYINEIVAVKVDSFSKIWNATDNKTVY